ncbi:MAG: heat-inducible transcriptional repressor HrcA [Micavibrio sp.]|nr:heat-inducible transcriptional repressor HrcA [Micavibrio sp.]|tara:strand:+ start:3714 stop:4757 length:1044 start_codon:yes stop_codon:yes gene_type:complete
MITELNERSREIFRYIVSSYLDTGSPVGSRTISKSIDLNLSPASIRNTMADLEEMGLLAAPHISAGRLPTERGLRLYIDGLMEIGALTKQERLRIEAECNIKGLSINEVIANASGMLSNLSACASLVIAPKIEKPVKQIQFVNLEPGKALIIMVMQNGMVENRIMDIPRDLPETALIQASNFLNSKLNGQTLQEIQGTIALDIKDNKTQLDKITANLVAKGIAVPLGKEQNDSRIIIRGQSHLLEDVKAIEDLERARTLLGYLEEQKNMLKLVDNVSHAQGVQIYLGAENEIFDQSGWSMILSPYRNADEKIVGAIGVIGPTRLDYDRIIPMVDYTSQVIARLVDDY